jgi:hypothetical protein
LKAAKPLRGASAIIRPAEERCDRRIFESLTGQAQQESTALAPATVRALFFAVLNMHASEGRCDRKDFPDGQARAAMLATAPA